MGTIIVHCQAAWLRYTSEQAVLRWVVPQNVNMVIDYPLGFALDALPYLENPVVVVTSSKSSYYLQDLIEFEPAAVLTEPLDLAEAEAIVKAATLNTRRIYPTLLERDRLSPRERQVLRLLAKGLSDKQIALELQVGPRTVSNWVLSLRQKLGAENRAEAMLHYWGLTMRSG